MLDTLIFIHEHKYSNTKNQSSGSLSQYIYTNMHLISIWVVRSNLQDFVSGHFKVLFKDTHHAAVSTYSSTTWKEGSANATQMSWEEVLNLGLQKDRGKMHIMKRTIHGSWSGFSPFAPKQIYLLVSSLHKLSEVASIFRAVNGGQISSTTNLKTLKWKYLFWGIFTVGINTCEYIHRCLLLLSEVQGLW